MVDIPQVVLSFFVFVLFVASVHRPSFQLGVGELREECSSQPYIRSTISSFNLFSLHLLPPSVTISRVMSRNVTQCHTTSRHDDGKPCITIKLGIISSPAYNFKLHLCNQESPEDTYICTPALHHRVTVKPLLLV